MPRTYPIPIPRGLLVVGLLLLCLRPGAAEPAATQSGWTPPDPMELKNEEITLLKRQLGSAKGELAQEKIQRVVDETQLRCAALRGFHVRKEVRSAPLTKAVLKRLVDDSTRRQYPGRSLEFYVWFNQLFNALPEGIDLLATMNELMGEQAAGVYDPQSETLYVRSDFSVDAPLGRMILAHEICHAMQDQNHKLLGMGVEDIEDSDRAMAVLAIAEGDAMLLMSEYLAKYSNPLSILGDLPRILSVDQQKFDAAPVAIQQAVLFPYLKGMNFFTVLAGRTRGGDPCDVGVSDSSWRSAIFKTPPLTTSQILHPEQYLARKLPAKIAPLRDERATTCTVNVAGEFGIATVLAPLLGKAAAEAAATGWNGDRLLIADHEQEGRRVLRWVTRWDTPQQAGAFAAALEKAFGAKFTGELKWQGQPRARRGRTGAGELEILRPAVDTVEIKGRFRLDAKGKGTVALLAGAK